MILRRIPPREKIDICTQNNRLYVMKRSQNICAETEIDTFSVIITKEFGYQNRLRFCLF